MRCLFTTGVVSPKSEEKKLFQLKICYRTVKVEIQEQKLCWVCPCQRGPKNRFLTTMAKAAAYPRLMRDNPVFLPKGMLPPYKSAFA